MSPAHDLLTAVHELQTHAKLRGTPLCLAVVFSPAGLDSFRAQFPTVPATPGLPNLGGVPCHVVDDQQEPYRLFYARAELDAYLAAHQPETLGEKLSRALDAVTDVGFPPISL